jgi:Lysophospholipase L1 and related esterases
MIKKIWPLILFASIILMFVFLTGLIISITITNGGEKKQETLSEATEPIQTEPSSTNKAILVLGDSIGFGVGDDPDMGLGKRYAALIDPEKNMEVVNLSVSGAISSELAALVVAPENAPYIAAADLIIISIGGNDLSRLQSEDARSLEVIFQETFNAYKENLETTLSRIRVLNPEAQIALIGLYNPYPEQDPRLSQKLFEWNYKTQLMADADLKTAYIPTADTFKYHLDTYLAADRFHPSNIGYQVIAEALDRVLNGID